MSDFPKNMEEEINELGATIYEQSLRISQRLLIDQIKPTKDEVDVLSALKKQFNMMNSINKALKKGNKVGVINEEEWQEKFAKIRNKKSSLGEIVVSIHKDKDAV